MSDSGHNTIERFLMGSDLYFTYLQRWSRRTLGMLTLLFALPTIAVGQEPTPLALPSVTPNVVSNTTSVEPRKIRIDLARGAYNLSATAENTASLVYELEQSAYEKCAPDLLLSLKYIPATSAPECRAVLEEIKKIDIRNPLLRCFIAGFESKACIDAFSAQEFQAVDDKTPQLKLSFSLKEARYKETLETLEQQLAAAFKHRKSGTADSGSGHNDSAEKAKYYARQYLAIACKQEALLLQPIAGERSTAQENLKKQPRTLDLSDFDRRHLPPTIKGSIANQRLMKMRSPMPDPSESKKAPEVANSFRRIRLLSGSCVRMIKLLEDRIPQLSSLACAKEGVGPNCIIALSKERHEKLTSGTSPGQVTAPSPTPAAYKMEEF